MRPLVWEGHVFKIDKACDVVTDVTKRFKVLGENQTVAASALGHRLLREGHNKHGDYHKFLLNLASGKKWFYGYSVRLEEIGRARHGVHVS